ncbi:hypothetical protein [Roseateles violae]|uniref:Uncharacterized protein n=1 Tax=Roseateles violae TaxID=3058042 RepID=A0ABT8DRJ9_9BURK|nr:hypothetical protein [Pelomonas sp. PFR6]MDN3920661.1 hypothetical protein [Pelomonas sp. PFR6]
MAVKRMLPMLLAGLALYRFYQWQLEQREQQRRREHAPKAKAPEVTTWEGEGGALKSTGAQLGPEPSATAARPSDGLGGP